jgi:DNA (cytosine-5)-methyltransferase 1
MGCKIEGCCGVGNATNTKCEGLEGQHREWQRCTEHRSDEGLFVGSKSEFIASDTNRNGLNERNGNDEVNTSKGGEYALGDINTSNVNGHTANTESIGRKKALEIGELERGRFRFRNKPHFWNSFPLESPICGGDDGIPTELDGITFPKWRAESIKGYGNAIVPQIAYQLFQIINEL